MGVVVSSCFAMTHPSGALQHTVLNGSCVYILFYRWVVYASSSIRRRFHEERAQVTTLSLRLARCHQTIADHEETIARALNQVHERENNIDAQQTATQMTCVVCAETVDAFVRCDVANHATCLSCLDKMCETLYLTPSAEFSNHCRCQAVSDCDGHISLGDAMRTESGMRFVREVHFRSAIPHVSALLPMTLDDASIRLRYLRHDGTYNANACPRCGHGPLEHFRCSDLTEFHEKNGYKNACPKCGNFVADTSDLVEWTGDVVAAS